MASYHRTDISTPLTNAEREVVLTIADDEKHWSGDGMVIIRAESLAALQPFESNGYEIESEIMMAALLKKLRIVEVPIHVPMAVPGVTVMDGFKVALGLLPQRTAASFARLEPWGPGILLAVLLIGFVTPYSPLSAVLDPFLSFFSRAFTGSEL